MTLLMLCDIPVYDITADKVLEPNLCPFLLPANTKKSYETWRKNRSYLKSNRMAERIVVQTGGAGTREAKRRMSLSDCFWVKYPYDGDTKFADITPYQTPFSLMTAHKGNARSSSVPELVLGGSQPKQWGKGQEGITYMQKTELPNQVHAEMLAVKLAHTAGIKCMNAFVVTDKGKIYAKKYSVDTKHNALGFINLVNITNTDRSMVQFDQLGISVNGYDPVAVAEAYKKAGVIEDVLKISLSQILFDVVVGNNDRQNNNSNWAVFMDNTTGKRKPSWMYDFNWANLVTKDNKMLTQVIANVKRTGFEDIACKILEPIRLACIEIGVNLWVENTQTILDALCS